MSDDVQTSAGPDRDPRTEWERSVEFRFGIGDRQFARIRREMKEMRSELNDNSAVTREIRDVVMAFAAFARFCKRVGRVIAWFGQRLAWVGRVTFTVLKIGGAIAASAGAIWAVVWAVMHDMRPPDIQHEALPGHQPPGRSDERPFSSQRK